MKKWILIALLILTVSASFIVCGNAGIEDNVSDKIYFESGDYWDVYIDLNNLETSFNKKYFIVKYSYKGNLEDLKKANQISFSQGTFESTQVVTVKRNKINKKDFYIKYIYNDTKEAIINDRMNLQVKIQGSNYIDSINDTILIMGK